MRKGSGQTKSQTVSVLKAACKRRKKAKQTYGSRSRTEWVFVAGRIISTVLSALSSLPSSVHSPNIKPSKWRGSPRPWTVGWEGNYNSICQVFCCTRWLWCPCLFLAVAAMKSFMSVPQSVGKCGNALIPGGAWVRHWAGFGRKRDAARDWDHRCLKKRVIFARGWVGRWEVGLLF